MTSSSLFFLLVHCCTIFILSCNIVQAATQNFTAILIFGDSTVDTGNNNYVNTPFQGNHLPYGQDFPGHIPTGRFSNGKLIPDFVASRLGIKETVPPFLDPNLLDEDLKTGVCFASAGSGYDDLTDAATGVIPVSKQLGYFNDYMERLNALVGEAEAQRIIQEALVIISAGTNDFGSNYYDVPTRRAQYNISQYQDFLQTKMQDFIKELYNHGFRKMAIAGLPPVGCLPIQITARFKNLGERVCLKDQNSDAQAYNQKLTKLLTQLQASLPGSTIAYADVYTPLMDMVNNPNKYGFTETNRGCCGTGFFEAASLCHTMTPMCRRASQFLFWDCIHPSESAYDNLSKYLENQLRSVFTA